MLRIKSLFGSSSHSNYKIVQRKLSSTSQIFCTKSTPKTHYDLFPQTLKSGPPPLGSFDIDTRALRREYLQLQAVAHPDRHAPVLKQHAENESARINEAYKTLQNPLSRAQYILSLRFIDICEDEAETIDPNFLAEVMEAREEIEEAQDNPEALVSLGNKNEKKIQKCIKLMGEAFERDNWEIAKVETIKLKYWMSIKNSLD